MCWITTICTAVPSYLFRCFPHYMTSAVSEVILTYSITILTYKWGFITYRWGWKSLIDWNTVVYRAVPSYLFNSNNKTIKEIQHRPFFLCLFSFFITLQTVKRHITFPIPWGAEVFFAGLQTAVGIACKLCWTVNLSPYKQLRDTRPLLFLEGDRGCLYCIISALQCYVTLRGFAVPKRLM